MNNDLRPEVAAMLNELAKVTALDPEWVASATLDLGLWTPQLGALLDWCQEHERRFNGRDREQRQELLVAQAEAVESWWVAHGFDREWRDEREERLVRGGN